MNSATRNRSWILGAMIFSVLPLAVLSALLIVARPVQAQTETVLYNFTGGSDGANPYSRLTSDGAGNFYGTTQVGGLGYGTVFELSPNGSGGWNETVLYSFCSQTYCADGSYPGYSSVILDEVGNLYGTAYSGGSNGKGVVFELSPAGGSWTETVLYSFAGGGFGANPNSSLIMDQKSNLYGATYAGGKQYNGIVFELRHLIHNGGGWKEHVIYDPPGETNATIAGVTMDAAGNIFGTSTTTVFELSQDGDGDWTPTVIHTFTGAPKDGIAPEGTLVFDQAGSLYGTTPFGGAQDCGTVYKLRPGRNGKWRETILHSFACGPNGTQPYAGIVFDTAGNIFGTLINGGYHRDGAVFELVAPVYSEKVLWNFTGTDGTQPYSGLILDSAGNLYGTTLYGGSSNSGAVFEVTP